MCHDLSATTSTLRWPTWVSSCRFSRSRTTRQAGSCVSDSSWYDILFEPREAGETGRAVLNRKARLNLHILTPHSQTEKCSLWFDKNASSPAGKAVPGLCLSRLTVVLGTSFTNTAVLPRGDVSAGTSLMQQTISCEHSVQLCSFNDWNIRQKLTKLSVCGVWPFYQRTCRDRNPCFSPFF